MALFRVKTLNGDSITLDDNNEIHRGGEGRIIMIDSKSSSIVAKIYHPGIQNISEIRYNQLQKLDSDYFIKPIELLFKNKKIVGYSMHYAGKDFFPFSSVFTRNFCQRNGINGKFKIKIAGKLIEAVKSAHFNGYVIGDLNQYNILINLKGEVKFIDVDSYETPGFKHSGILLDEIRDYYYQGQVSPKSDYFALSVLLFNMFTYTHPFKGIHDKFKSLAERMINKIPVFANDPLLKVPKCYEPVQNQSIQNEFNRFYLNCERFLFNLTTDSFHIPVNRPNLAQKIEEDNLTLQIVLQNDEIRNVIFTKNIGFIETNKKFVLFTSKFIGYLNNKFETDRKNFDELFLGNENIIARRNNNLFHIKNANEFIEIKNFYFPQDAVVNQRENILIVIGQGQMFWVYLDEVIGSSVRVKRTEVFGSAFSNYNGLLQVTGGIQRLFYNTGKEIAVVKTEKRIKKLYQNANTGMVQFIEKSKIVNQYFRIRGLKIDYSNSQPGSFVEFAFLNAGNDDGFVFEQGDNKINIRRTADFEIVSEISCPNITSQSILFYTNSGIVAWENNIVYLINQKK